MDQTIQEFVQFKNIAIVGGSRKGNKFGNAAAKELSQRGYSVYYIHPEAEELDGHSTYSNLKAVRDFVDTVWISVKSDQGMAVLREAAEVGLTRLWIQQGGDTPELIQLGRELGLQLITGKCILMYAEPVRSFHKFHQIIWKLIGQY